MDDLDRILSWIFISIVILIALYAGYALYVFFR